MKRILGMAGIAAALATASPARADHAEELAAQTLYDKALELMKAGKAASACPLLAESQRLDPAAGTQYWLAECFEKTGRTEAAWRLYTEVAEASKAAGRKDREEKARERAEAVWKLLPRLRITVPPEFARVEGLTVTRDSKSVPREQWNLESPVHAGEHSIEARAPGKKPWLGTRTARAGATEDVQVPALEALPVVGAPASEVALPLGADAVETPRVGLNKLIVIAGAAAGVVALGVGIGFAVASSAKADQINMGISSGCPGGFHEGEYWDCSAALLAMQANRETFTNVARAGFISAALLGAGTMTYALLGGSSTAKNKPTAAVVVLPGGVWAMASIPW